MSNEEKWKGVHDVVVAAEVEDASKRLPGAGKMLLSRIIRLEEKSASPSGKRDRPSIQVFEEKKNGSTLRSPR